MAFSCCHGGASPRLLVSLLLLSLNVLQIHARLDPETAVADAQHSRSKIPEDAANSHRQFDSDSRSPEVRPSKESVSAGGGAPRSTTAAAGSGGAVESIAEWKRRSAEAGAHFFPLQRAEDAPSREEIHRRILAPKGVGGGLKGKGESGKVSNSTGSALCRCCLAASETRVLPACVHHCLRASLLACITACVHHCVQAAGFPLPQMEYDSTLVSTANGTMGNTMVNYSTFAGGSDKIRLPVYPYYVNLKLGSQKQEFSMALNVALPFTFVPCNCLHCGSSRKGVRLVWHSVLHPPSHTQGGVRWGKEDGGRGTTYSKPFSTLSSTTLKYISCVDRRCLAGAGFGYYGCNTEGLPNYLNLTSKLPGDDALCVYDANAWRYDYYEADDEANSYIESVGHVVEDTVYLTAPDGTEVNRSIIFSCGVNQMGQWGMQGWQYDSWSAGGVLGLGWDSPFLYELTGVIDPSAFAVCLEEPTPTNKTGWDGKVPLMTGSSHLTIGATGLPAGASYGNMHALAGMQYSHITLTTAKRALNITDDPAYIDPTVTPYVPPGFPENVTPGFLFMPEYFVHLLRYPLFMSLCDGIGEMTGQELCNLTEKWNTLGIPCFQNKKKAGDPFTTFPTIDIAFLSPDNTTAHFYLKPREYLAQVSASEYCMLVVSVPHSNNYNSYIGEPALFNKYLFLDYTNKIAGWMDAPSCGAEPLLPPPSPPPPSPGTNKATHSLSPLPAALSAAVVLATSATLLALTLL
ncbi:unnamed protein product [Closterium sp. Naga37s-1]|nr:unnamed protein product [Closterium sp. Naga37s-1]